MKSYELLVFDWDGTLMDSLAFIVQCVQETSVDLGLEPLDDAFIRKGIGLGLVEQIERLFPGQDHNLVAYYYGQHYFSGDEGVALYPDVLETLTYLKQKGYRLAIATSKGRRGLEAALKQFKLDGVFEVERCGDDGFAKPQPEMLLSILEALDVAPDAAIMIGDTEYDMQLAQNAGVDALGVTHGVHSCEQLNGYNPVACVDSIAALKDLF